MSTVVTILVVCAIILTILSAVWRVPLWIPVLLLAIVEGFRTLA